MADTRICRRKAFQPRKRGDAAKGVVPDSSIMTSLLSHYADLYYSLQH
ncbi:MAG: hypothetical protein NT023_22160 [Armatimonadetes bacterium]|nr:hypothetical protein [Armatimonadota bacterium]